jgi:hypothetical protein
LRKQAPEEETKAKKKDGKKKSNLELFKEQLKLYVWCPA